MLARVDLLISEMIDPPLPIRQPIRDVGTSRRVVNENSPDSLSVFSLHLGCKRNAASKVGDMASSKNYHGTKYECLFLVLKYKDRISIMGQGKKATPPSQKL